MHSGFRWFGLWSTIIFGASSRFLDEYHAAELEYDNGLISCVDEIARNFFRNRENVLIISVSGSVVAGEIVRQMQSDFAINLATKDSRINFGAIIDYIVLEGDDVIDAHDLVESMTLNPRGRYVIVTGDEPEDIEITAGEFWSAGIPNMIFVKPLIDEAVIFGYGISSRPHHANATLELRVLDHWKGKFTEGRNLFPNKFTNMNNYPLKVGIMLITMWDNLDMVVTKEHGEYKSSGIGSKILYEFAEKLNFKVVLSFGPSGENLTTDEVIDRLNQRDIDITFTCIEPYFSEVESMDYSGPYLTARIFFGMRSPRRTVAWNSMFQTFSIELWTWLFLTLLASLCLALSIKKLWAMNMLREYIRPLDVLKVYFAQGIVYPNHSGLRLALAFWMLYGYLVVAAFSGSLLKFLSMPHFHRDPRNFEEALNSELVICVISEFKTFLLDTSDPDMMALSDRFETRLDNDEEFGQFFATGFVNVMSDTYVTVWNWQNRRNESLLIRMIDDNMFNFPYFFYMWKGHPYREPLDRFIGEAQSAGLINKWISESNALPVQGKTKKEATAVVLSLEHFVSVFLALACGSVAGILTFLYELYCGRGR